VETVAPTLSHQLSIELDSSGVPHVAYIDDETLNYGYWNGSGWDIQIVDTVGFDNVYTSLALGSDDNPHIAYYAFDGNYNVLRYARYINNTWVMDDLDFGIITSDFISIDVDVFGQAYIAYRDAHFGDGNLRCIFYNNDDWNRSIVDTSGRSPSVKVNYPGFPGISYYDPSTRVLKYAHYSSGWQISVVDDSSDAGYYSSLVYDSNHNPRIVYFDSTNIEIKYAQYNGSIWSIEQVDVRDDVGYFCSVALDANDTPHFSYTYAEEPEGYFEIIYAYKAGGSYHKQVVLGSNGMASMSPIALDGDSQPHILYSKGLDDPALNYIWREGSSPANQGKLAAEAHDHGILLRWDNDGENPYGYQLWRSRVEGNSTLRQPLTGTLESNSRMFLDTTAEAGIEYCYELESFDHEGNRYWLTTTATRQIQGSATPRLDQPFPCPAESYVRLGYELPETTNAVLALYDISGRRVALLESGTLSSGRHEVGYDVSWLPSGIYLLRLNTPASSLCQRLVITR
jgi:hypothetical protein